MAVESGDRRGILSDVRYDLKRLHENWMALVYPRQRETDHSVLGKWKPRTTSGWIGYRLWGLLGVSVVGLLYPLALAGLVVRFYTRRIDNTAAWLGILGVLGVTVLAWGALTVLAHLRFSFQGFLAVLAAAIVATVSAGAAVLFARTGGRPRTVLLAYPASMTALFLPPVVAALYSPALAGVVFPGSRTLAIWLLDTVLAVGGLNELLRSRYTLDGVAFVGMWFGIAVPLGWILGAMVSFADLLRP